MNEILNLPTGHKVIHSSSVVLPLQNALCKIHKVYDPVKDSQYQLSYDNQNNKIEFDQLLKKEQDLYTRKYGKLHPALFETLSKQPAQNFEVMVWLNIPSTEPSKTSFKEEELNAEVIPQKIKEARAAQFKRVSSVIEGVAHAAGVKVKRQSKIAPAFIATANSEEIKKMAASDEVMLITLHESKGIDNLQSSLNVSNGQQVVYTDGNKGRNIKVAVWESGPDVTTDLVITDRFDSTPTTSTHARLTTAIIKNKEADKPHGYAPECKMFSANDKDTNALEWAVEDKNCRVISQSFHRSSEETSGSLSSDDILKDYLVLHYPYPTIVQAAGNILQGQTSGEFVNHKGYNSLAVGNHNDLASAMSTDTTFRNPTTSHGDRELPEISANGTNVSAVDLTMSGTSFSAPAVAGSSAVLMGINGLLQSWPEGIRAILLAGATKNVRGNNWPTDLGLHVDAKDGAGALNLKESAAIAKQRKTPGNVPSQRGFDVGRFDNNDFSSSGLARAEYKIKVPHTGPTHVKVALAWDAQVWKLLWLKLGRLPIDLDLKIYKGSTLVAYSASWDNSYEIAEYNAKPGDELTIKINKFSGDDWTYYGIAWSVF